MEKTIKKQSRAIEMLRGTGPSFRIENSNVMGQNRPNPFKGESKIECHISKEAGRAFIGIFDLNGNQKRLIEIEGRGDVTVNINSSGLVSGLYVYSLIVDGEEIISKRMLVAD